MDYPVRGFGLARAGRVGVGQFQVRFPCSDLAELVSYDGFPWRVQTCLLKDYHAGYSGLWDS